MHQMMMIDVTTRRVTSTTTRSMTLLLIKGLLLLGFMVISANSKTFRYHTGVPDGDSKFFDQKKLSVPAARHECNAREQCVLFSFSSPTRFPEGEIDVFFFDQADWHVKTTTGERAFVEDLNWHSYVNTTREMQLIEPEVRQVLAQLQNPPAKLRGSQETTSLDRNMKLLEYLFDVVGPRAHRLIATPFVTPYALEVSGDTSKPEPERLTWIKLLIVMGDSPETGKALISLGVYQAMKKIVLNRNEWDELSETALDAIANICFFRSANDELRKLGAAEFLKSLVSEPGFPGLQASMSLMHLQNEDVSLPKEMIQELVTVLENAIDGDPSHGILWDLIPGPLSAIKYLIRHGKNPEPLLDAGLMEQLLRILESDNADELIATLQIFMELSRYSERARDMILLADHNIRDVRERLGKFEQVISLSTDLSNFVLLMDSPRLDL